MPCPSFGTSGLNTYADFTRSESHYLTRADEQGLSIEYDLTLGCWVYFDLQSIGRTTGIMGKWVSNGNQCSYALYKTDNDVFAFSVSNNGSNILSISDTGLNFKMSQWFYVVGRFTPSSEMSLFVNGIWYKYRSINGVPASIFNSSADFEIGIFNQANYLDGRISQAFICAYSVPDVFVCAMFSHTRALYMNRLLYSNPCTEVFSNSGISPNQPQLPPCGHLLLEDGSHLLLETGDKLLFEGICEDIPDYLSISSSISPSVSPSKSPSSSVSRSASPSNSPSASSSRSVSPSKSPSSSASRSSSPSKSPSSSVSRSFSPSKSPSSSISRSVSPSKSPSSSESRSASPSSEVPTPPSASVSPSVSRSTSRSKSPSASASPSTISSVSPSASRSVSPSVSRSKSPSSSTSRSVSPSVSPSDSLSVSPSVSSSESSSVSPSVSPSEPP